MPQVEKMCLSLVVAKRHELTWVTEVHTEWIFQDPLRDAREVLEHSVRGNMHEFDCVLFPFRAHAKDLAGGIELQVTDSSGQVHYRFQRGFIQFLGLLVKSKHIDYASIWPSR